jgi:hypothetical protein
MERASAESNDTTSIAPWLSVPDGDAALKFYTEAFGAVELERLADEGGTSSLRNSRWVKRSFGCRWMSTRRQPRSAASLSGWL